LYAGPATVIFEAYDADDDRWHILWKTTTTSADMVAFTGSSTDLDSKPTLSKLRIRSTAKRNPTFSCPQGFVWLVLRSASAGQITLAAASVMETAAGSSFVADSGDLIDFTANDRMDLRSAHQLEMVSDSLTIHSKNYIEVLAESALVAANETMVLFSQEMLSATAGELLVDTVGDASVTAVHAAKLEAGSAAISAVDSAQVAAANVGVVADDSLSFYGGEMLIGAQGFNISSESSTSIMSGGKMAVMTSLLTTGSPLGHGNASNYNFGSNVEAPMVINARDQIIRSSGHVEVHAADKVSAYTQGLEIDARRFHSMITGDIEVISGKSLLIQAPREITSFGHATSLLNTNTKITTVEDIQLHAKSLILDTLEDSLSIAMSEDLNVGVESMAVSAGGDINVRSSQDMDFVVNEDAHISASHRLTIFAQGSADLISENLLVQTDVTDFRSASMQVAGTEALTIATNDAAVAMQRLGATHVTELQLHFKYSFDEFENLVPRIAGVIEIAILTPGEVIQANCAPLDATCRTASTAPVPRVETGTHGQIDLQSVDGDWQSVWANKYTSGQDDSLVGFRRDLDSIDVVGVRFARIHG
jgi:hypothetical protein